MCYNNYSTQIKKERKYNYGERYQTTINNSSNWNVADGFDKQNIFLKSFKKVLTNIKICVIIKK